MKIAEKEYNAALKRIDELPPLVTDDTPYDDVHYPISDNSANITHSLLS